MKLCICCVILACASSALAADGATPQVADRRLPSGIYELTLTLENTADVAVAQQVLVPEARKACGGQLFEFGHYSFHSTEQTANGVASSTSPRVTIRQEVTCGPIAPKSDPHASYDWAPSDADDQLVAARTQEYLAHKDKGELALAYEEFSE